MSETYTVEQVWTVAKSAFMFGFGIGIGFVIVTDWFWNWWYDRKEPPAKEERQP